MHTCKCKCKSLKILFVHTDGVFGFPHDVLLYCAGEAGWETQHSGVLGHNLHPDHGSGESSRGECPWNHTPLQQLKEIYSMRSSMSPFVCEKFARCPFQLFRAIKESMSLKSLIFTKLDSKVFSKVLSLSDYAVLKLDPENATVWHPHPLLSMNRAAVHLWELLTEFCHWLYVWVIVYWLKNLWITVKNISSTNKCNN